MRKKLKFGLGPYYYLHHCSFEVVADIQSRCTIYQKKTGDRSEILLRHFS